MRVGIDIGSTTIKVVGIDSENNLIYKKYERHMSNVYEKFSEVVENFYNDVGNISAHFTITGSGGLALSKSMGIHFEQEVVACSRAVEELISDTDVAIELGGEDAKITFYGGTIEQRMNGTCAGGTGAFIDQMSVLLNTDAQGLNEYAKNHTMIYPIAARCGVFAKTDIQPLINEGAAKENLAASIFQAVVNQTISGLACGRRIKGNVAFLGGPLSFLSELRKRFVETLELEEEQVIFPEEAKYFVAIGAAIISETQNPIFLEEIINKLKGKSKDNTNEIKYIEPLFETRVEYDNFKKRHEKNKISRAEIKYARGNVFLGIDAGSTTTKAALIDERKNLLYSFYQGNEGNPIETVKKMLLELYKQLPPGAIIAGSTVTGYGEGLIKAAFAVDNGEIETMAHYKAAEEFLPGVDFILDIGGQDMKCMKIRDGAMYNIMLNEACSSGCGSFLETYAKSVNMDTVTFSKEALFAKSPVDLGTRCTVFMNSKVKQAQKEGATIGDISAGLSYSVIKNALYKVIKLRNPEEAGEKIVVQGGTFLNEAVLRCIENVIGREVVRPDVAGIMGAYGAALLAKQNYVSGTESSIYDMDDLKEFSINNNHARCEKCENKCLLTISTFNNNEKFVTGNRCEKGAGKSIKKNKLPDMFEYKVERTFNFTPLSEDRSKRGTVGIPRVLNMYENYPFWFKFFSQLGYRVVLSPPSTKEIYEKGMSTISSDTACYPAKLVHGHIQWLVDNGVKWIFYPCINHEIEEDPRANNHFNCPVVATYPEVIAKNMDDIFKEEGVRFTNPFLPYDNTARLTKELHKFLKPYGVGIVEVENAVNFARKADKRFKDDIKKYGDSTLKFARENGKKIIVLAGRPYHLDPEVNHGINQVITSHDMVVLTEDSVSNIEKLVRPIRVLDQWMYHTRLYRAAEYVCTTDDVELIQLNSFGCGLDAVTVDQVEEITKAKNKLYTVLKIDEGNNLGAAKIRIRSLKSAIEARTKYNIKREDNRVPYKRKVFTKKMKKDYTILVPQMSPIHFSMVENAMRKFGYNAKLLPDVDTHAIEEGLRYINNDSCYPTIVTLGQIISYLKSGKVDLNKTAIFMTQTGGGCRASNYIALLRKALKDLNMEHIPVISINMSGIESNPGFKLKPMLIKRLLMGIVYGDLFMRVLYKTRPYELVEGSADRLYKKWSRVAARNITGGSMLKYNIILRLIVDEFDKLPLRNDVIKPKVGVVGEILVKYHPIANNDIVKIIENEGGEAVVLDLLDFFLYVMYNKKFEFQNLSGTKFTMRVNMAMIKLLEHFRKPMKKALSKSVRFEPPARIQDVASKAEELVSLGNQCGEGWLLTGEMLELIDHGVENVACLQPFACLPNHITGKGMMKALRKRNPKANVVAIDYDPGASEVNQLNRIKLMMATAHKNLNDKKIDE